MKRKGKRDRKSGEGSEKKQNKTKKEIDFGKRKEEDGGEDDKSKVEEEREGRRRSAMRE